MTQLPHYQLFINGAPVEGAAGQTMATLNPATGEDWATFACAAPADVDAAVGAARAALDNPAWREIPVIVLTAKDLTDDDRRILSGRVEQIVEKGTQEIEQVADLIRQSLGEEGKKAATR